MRELGGEDEGAGDVPTKGDGGADAPAVERREGEGIEDVFLVAADAGVVVICMKISGKKVDAEGEARGFPARTLGEHEAAILFVRRRYVEGGVGRGAEDERGVGAPRDLGAEAVLRAARLAAFVFVTQIGRYLFAARIVGLHHVFFSRRRGVHAVAQPRMAEDVGVGRKFPIGEGHPLESEIEATFVLHVGLREGIGKIRLVATVVITVKEEGGKIGGRRELQGIKRRPRPVLRTCRLTEEFYPRIFQPIINTDVEIASSPEIKEIIEPWRRLPILSAEIVTHDGRPDVHPRQGETDVAADSLHHELMPLSVVALEAV